MSDAVIQLRGITKRYGEHTAVHRLNLSIKKGEIFGLLGPNGAGKSTTILTIMGLTEPDSGIVEVCGINPTRKPIEVKQRVGYLPEDVGFYPQLTGLDNLVYTAQLNGLDKEFAKDKARAFIERVGLKDAMHKKVSTYSKGMRQRLGLADVLIKNPEVIILDEPTSGIDPKGVEELLNLIVELRNEHQITVLFSSHNLHQVQQVCDRVGIFVEGQLLAEGNLEELSQELFTKGSYLIELGISSNTNKMDPEQLKKILTPIEEVNQIDFKKDHFEIECSKDVSAEIAKKVIEAEQELVYLNKKEFGLDAIYNKYFENRKL
ncbi:ATP-binding cassette domain-containing protein [Flammeovirga yaeyamensis]|uniref:ATP-binding cassette domain-containing protein n=2 Tax=Flammeovirga yaeyamensis TaxID=367791 RepID=A0AAX1N8M8_9BACT|nr:ABC transporter ATP-binding protein [Flammeovirga yaeyamensis]QWG03939.1 ATP-binding cassette domain-containing protein [Flammeovirga yaeyamensis]